MLVKTQLLLNEFFLQPTCPFRLEAQAWIQFMCVWILTVMAFDNFGFTNKIKLHFFKVVFWVYSRLAGIRNLKVF